MPTDENFVYFNELGFTDGRSGRVRKGITSLSAFINYCVTEIVRQSKHNRLISLNKKELEACVTRYEMYLAQKEITKKSDEMQRLAIKLKELEKNVKKD